MASAFIGQVQAYGFNFAPRSWMTCSGQTLNISQYSSLFSLIGNYFGGNAQSTFALPNLVGRAPLHVGGITGTGPGLSLHTLGEKEGTSYVPLSESQMPTHTHGAVNTKVPNDTGTPSTSVYPSNLNKDGVGNAFAYNTVSPSTTTFMNSSSISLEGNSGLHENIQPYLALNFCIAMDGVYPSRNG